MYSNVLRQHYFGMTSVLPLSHRNKEHIIERVYLKKFREMFTQFYKILEECFMTSYVDVTVFMAVYVHGISVRIHLNKCPWMCPIPEKFNLPLLYQNIKLKKFQVRLVMYKFDLDLHTLSTLRKVWYLPQLMIIFQKIVYVIKHFLCLAKMSQKVNGVISNINC
jgi:uncharacterized protein YebE (UPF0316 family)